VPPSMSYLVLSPFPLPPWAFTVSGAKYIRQPRSDLMIMVELR
jgi:hypothetical protein